ncbi:MAG: MFS transporter [Bacteroidetes bacterium]|nr:MFS transporter [Bacteroidota bacterium]
MTEKIQKLLRDSKAARWTALLIVSFTMFAGYYLADAMAPLQGMLEKQLGWNANEYGFFTSAYGWFNVFLFFLIIGGIILDKMGIRFTGVASAAVMVAGAAIKYWAVSTHSLDGVIIFGWKGQVMMAAIGYAIFGVGVEIAGVTVSKIIVKWFKGYEMAFAMGLQVSIARLGTGLAISTALPVSQIFGSVSVPLLFGLVLLSIGLIAIILYNIQDKKLDVTIKAANLANESFVEEEEFKSSDIFSILKNKGWWYIAILCVLFYSAVFPFLKYATNLMTNKFDVSDNWAGLIPGLLPFGTIIFTPIFGSIYDKKGKGATIMIIGSLIIMAVHLLFAIPFLNQTIIAFILMIILGIGFSLVPSAMWPSVPKIIPERQLGTAYSLIFYVQNWGLMGVPLLIGWVLDKWCIIAKVTNADGTTTTTYDYQIPMLIFAGFGLLALLFAYLLKVEDKKKGYGLETPNIQK